MSASDIRRKGILHKQPNGRWAIDSDELTSGDCIALRAIKGTPAMFLKGRIEHGRDGYYFTWPSLEGGEGWTILLHEGLEAYRLPSGE